MNCLFLDIDDCLYSIRTRYLFNDCPTFREKETHHMFDPITIGLINKAIKDFDIKVILSSTWRKYNTIEDISKIIGIELTDKTPILNIHRGYEIKKYLEDNPQYTKYAIIDDGADMLDEQLPYFVRVGLDDGFSLANYKKLRSIFGDNDE